MKPLLVEFHLIKKVFVCVKDEKKNLATLNFTLFLVVLCDVFQLEKPYYGTYFVPVMSKVYKYTKNESKRFVKTLKKNILKIIMPFKRPSHG